MVVAQALADAEQHLAHDNPEANSARIPLKSWHHNLHENVAFELSVNKSGRNEESDDALLFVNVELLSSSLEGAKITTQAAEHNVGRHWHQRRSRGTGMQ